MNPIKKHPLFSLFFLVIVVAEMVGLTAYPQIRLASKGMIMASLIGFYIVTAKRQNHVFMLGMIFALLGDAFLLFESESFFLIGLGSFLIMQLCYARTFYSKMRIIRPSDKVIVGILALIPIIFLAVAWASLGALKYAVAVYSVVITLMLITAFLRHKKLHGYLLVLIGSIFFVVSDMLLAGNKFLGAIPYGNILVMATYIIAQYLIVNGIVLDDEPYQTSKSAVKGTFTRHKQN